MVRPSPIHTKNQSQLTEGISIIRYIQESTPITGMKEYFFINVNTLMSETKRMYNKNKTSWYPSLLILFTASTMRPLETKMNRITNNGIIYWPLIYGN